MNGESLYNGSTTCHPLDSGDANTEKEEDIQVHLVHLTESVRGFVGKLLVIKDTQGETSQMEVVDS